MLTAYYGRRLNNVRLLDFVLIYPNPFKFQTFNFQMVNLNNVLADVCY